MQRSERDLIQVLYTTGGDWANLGNLFTGLGGSVPMLAQCVPQCHSKEQHDHSAKDHWDRDAQIGSMGHRSGRGFHRKNL